MAKREHTLTVGRYQVIGDYEGVAIDEDGTLGMPSNELGRIELEAAIAVLSEASRSVAKSIAFPAKRWGFANPIWLACSTLPQKRCRAGKPEPSRFAVRRS
jgi:hypothetical protein